jgi:hypothetical protein
MKKSSSPNFENQNHGAGGGIPILKTMWEKFGFSYLFSNIDKHSGLSARKLVFAYISGLVANSSSVNKIAEHCSKSPIIREILGGTALSQSSLSRFFSKDFNWMQSSLKRVKSFCTASLETAICDGDVVALDDTKIEHPYGKKMPFLCWLFDNFPEMRPNKKGNLVKKQVYTPIAAVATIRLPEDMNDERVVIDIADPDEKAAHFKGAYLLISSRVNAPEQAVMEYAKRWKIEVFYRNAKQELGLTACHSQSKVAHEAHIEMIFIAETLLNYMNWELNKDGAITLTHGEVIREIINASHRVAFRNTLQLYFDISCIKFASFIKKYWPKYYDLGFGLMSFHLMDKTA